MEDGSKEEQSGCEVGMPSCVKGSRWQVHVYQVKSGPFAIALDKEYGRYAAIRKVNKDFGETRGKITLSPFCWRAAGVAYRAGHNNPNWHFLLHKRCFTYWILLIVDACIMYSHGCCIQAVCMDGTFQRKM